MSARSARTGVTSRRPHAKPPSRRDVRGPCRMSHKLRRRPSARPFTLVAPLNPSLPVYRINTSLTLRSFTLLPPAGEGGAQRRMRGPIHHLWNPPHPPCRAPSPASERRAKLPAREMCEYGSHVRGMGRCRAHQGRCPLRISTSASTRLQWPFLSCSRAASTACLAMNRASTPWLRKSRYASSAMARARTHVRERRNIGVLRSIEAAGHAASTTSSRPP